MKLSKTVFLVLLSLSLSACGAKESELPKEGLFKAPTDVVIQLSCKKVYKQKGTNMLITEEIGSEGSIETPCSGNKSYKLSNSLPNLNVTNVYVEKYFICKNSKGRASHGWVYQHNLAKGQSTFTLSTANKGDYLQCKGHFASPLPTTVVSNEDIGLLINKQNNNEIKNCEQSSKAYRISIESCSNEWTYGSNVIFTDDTGKQHAATRKKTWSSAINN